MAAIVPQEILREDLQVLQYALLRRELPRGVGVVTRIDSERVKEGVSEAPTESSGSRAS